MKQNMVKRFAVLICLSISVTLMFVAVSLYPGGSLFDHHSSGFDWTKNFFSNLFQKTAFNGMENPSRIWAIIGMAFHSVGYGIFFIHMSKKIPNAHAAWVLKIVGYADIIFNFLIATSLHDIMIAISSTISMLGLFYITVFSFKTKLNVVKAACVICMLTFYYTMFLYGYGDWVLLAIMQKVALAFSVLLILGLEYFTRKEHYATIT